MSITSTSQAAVVGSSVENQAFAVTARAVPRKIVIVGTFNPLKTDIVPNVPIRVYSPEEVGALTGFGFMLHRLAVQSFRGSQGIETWIIPQAETGTQATGNIDFTGSTGTNDKLYLYIAGILEKPVIVQLSSGLTASAICLAVVNSINRIKELPVTAAVNVTPEICDITSKTTGEWGNDISISFNRKSGETLPINVVASITPMSGGTATYSIGAALNAMGVGDDANEKFFTALSHGYNGASAALDAISTYVGKGNEKIGTYAETVHRPFQSLIGDVVPGNSGFTTVLALAELRKESDRANGVISVPGSYSHPEEIAAQAIGHRERIANIRPEENYVDIILENIDPGDIDDRWTSYYTNRDGAVKKGVSPTRIKNDAVYLQNVVTFYHPDSISPESNGYASFRDLAIIQNLLDSQYRTFNTDKWKNFTIVEDVTKVTDVNARLKARDIDAVLDEAVALINVWLQKAWIYEKTFAIQNLIVTIRGGTDGFDIRFKTILSGEGLILNVNTIFDTSIAVLNQ